MNQLFPDSTVEKELTACYGSLSTPISSIVTNRSLCMYCDKQSE